jgi:histidine ammonia-lyase
MIHLDGHTLNLEQLWRVATEGAPCQLALSARRRMKQSRKLVERLAAEPRAIYGINTGFGPLSGTRVAPADLAQHQLNLLHHLSVGQGPLFSPVETRAIMAARANALARGYSGIRPEVVDLLIAALNHNILPEIPCEGSVGASGDLAPLAHMSRLLVGLGHVRIGGKRLLAAAALKRRHLEPVTLKCKEGLALVNGTSVMAGLAALAAQEAGALLSWSELLTSCLFQVLWAAPEVLCEQAHKARGFRGQSAVAERIAGHLRTHPRYKREIEEHEWGSHAKPVEPGAEIQDPYSVRCAPQVLGAIQEALWHVQYIVARELNASTDNPLVFPETESVIHCGNFYGQQIAMACDYLRLGLAKLALLVDRQLERLVNWRYSLGLPPMLTGASNPGLNSGLMGVQLLATSLAAECRVLSTPASVQTIPTNANNQDVVSMGTIAARMTRAMLPKLWTLTALQALALAQAADLRAETIGGDFQKLRRFVREVSPRLVNDRPLFEEIASLTRKLQSDAGRRLLAPRPAAPGS